MAMMTTSTTALANQFQTTFNKKLLERARLRTVLDQFATKAPFPKNAGAKTMRFFRQQAGAASEVSTLSEGVPLTTYSEVGLDYIEATLAQYGMVIKMSDVMGMTELFSTLLMSKDRMAENAALHADQIVRNTIIAGVTGTTEKLYANGDADFAALVADTTAGYLTIEDLLRAYTRLTINRAPKKDGEYFMVSPPQVTFDLKKDTKWYIPVNTYQDKTNVVKGEVGKWFNVRVVETDVPFREANTGGTEGTFAATGPIFASIVTGADAYGTPIMAGNSPYSPHIYINDKEDKSDPLNQTVLAGFKTYWASVVLNALWAVVIRSKTSFA